MSSRPRSCFRQYFLGGYIPEELEINFNDTPSVDIRYICQTRDNIFTEYYYATLYDEKYGVPVYSGYRISRSQGVNIDTISYRQRPRSSAWQTTPGEWNLFIRLIWLNTRRPKSGVLLRDPNTFILLQRLRFYTFISWDWKSKIDQS